MMRVLKNLWHLVDAWWWVGAWGYPGRSLTAIGVTGTDGKTTTATLVYEMLRAAGYKAGLVTTVAAKIGDTALDMALHVTNPEPKVLQELLRRMADGGCTHAVIEVTSHGLDQHRVAGCNFRVAVLTNISHEHLDYHGTMERYMAAKLKLFKGVKYAVLNGDDPSFNNFQLSISNFQIKPQIIKFSKTKIKEISPALGGEYNKYNIGAAAAVAAIFKIQETIIKRVVKEFAGVPGRREEVKMGQKFRAIVDFAHTPNALEQLLKTLRQETKGQLILVFGCTGERDRDKRPIMGEVAERLADVVIVTSDDVRGEDQNMIYENIVAGTKWPEAVLKENDRDKAIAMGVKMARTGDCVVAAGMGHETTQLIGKTEIKRSDREAFEKAIGDVLSSDRIKS